MVRIGIITDIHIAPAGEPDGAWHNAYSFPDAAARFQRALLLLQQEGADAIAILGDVVNNGDDASLDGGIALAAAAPAPLYLVGGNHDLTSGEDALARAISRAGAGASHLHLVDGTGQPLGDGLRLAGIQPRPGRPPYGMRAGEVTTAPWGGDVVILYSHFPVFS